jgi:hypothetical protein
MHVELFRCWNLGLLNGIVERRLWMKRQGAEVKGVKSAAWHLRDCEIFVSTNSGRKVVVDLSAATDVRLSTA